MEGKDGEKFSAKNSISLLIFYKKIGSNNSQNKGTKDKPTYWLLSKIDWNITLPSPSFVVVAFFLWGNYLEIPPFNVFPPRETSVQKRKTALYSLINISCNGLILVFSKETEKTSVYSAARCLVGRTCIPSVKCFPKHLVACLQYLMIFWEKYPLKRDRMCLLRKKKNFIV